MKSVKEIAIIAAGWWADRVTSPKFDNGDKILGGFFAKTYAAKAVQPVDQVQRDKFIEHLVHSITTKLDRPQATEVLLPDQEPIPPVDIVLGIDYSPDRELLGAALYSGIPGMNFPIKTVMWISKNHVAVRYGYSAGVEHLYANSTYWTRRIADLEESIQRHSHGNYLSYIADEEERKIAAEKIVAELQEDLGTHKIELEASISRERNSEMCKRSQAMTSSFKQIYGVARQCGKVDFTTEALKALERDPNCPPERPMEDILHEVMCSGCGAFDAACELTDGEWLCRVCAETHKAYYGDPQVCTDLDEANLTEEQNARIDAFFNAHNRTSLSEVKEELNYWAKAEKYLDHSNCLKRQYGCVIVKDGIIISSGFNSSRVPCVTCIRENVEHSSGDYAGCPAIHAEQMALMKAGSHNLKGAKLYLVSNDGLNVTCCPTCQNIMDWYRVVQMHEPLINTPILKPRSEGINTMEVLGCFTGCKGWPKEDSQ